MILSFLFPLPFPFSFSLSYLTGNDVVKWEKENFSLCQISSRGAESRAKNLLVLEKQMNQIGNISSHREVSLYIGGYSLKF